MWEQTRRNLEDSDYDLATKIFRRITLNKLERFLYGSSVYTHAQAAEFIRYMIKDRKHNRSHMTRVLLDIRNLPPLSEGIAPMASAVLRVEGTPTSPEELEHFLSFIPNTYTRTAACLLVVGFRKSIPGILGVKIGDYDRKTGVLLDKKLPMWSRKYIEELINLGIALGGDNLSYLFERRGKHIPPLTKNPLIRSVVVSRHMKKAQLRSGVNGYDYYKRISSQFVPNGLVRYSQER